ncbi:MAG TPA: SDR family oxidoreductase [Steroidobacteraceae bacterium]|jgi:NAD(P)-dependent dehydrogenase (short-subunit alcohol dehydrogenase family)
MGRIDGKVSIVLGAAGAGNMGQVIARRLAAEGARVVLAGRHLESLRGLAAELSGDSFACDITRREDLEALVRFTVERHQRLDVAVNCTGWAPMTKLLEVQEAELDKLCALQIKGVYFFLQQMAAQMIANGGGSIVQMSSASAYALLYNHAAYIATKSAGDALVRCFANEFGAKGVRVNAIAPGLTQSPMTAKEIDLPGLKQAFVKEYPLGRIGTADDVANAALWLASDESFMTGQVLQINGGLTLRRNPLPWEINASMRAAKNSQP